MIRPTLRMTYPDNGLPRMCGDDPWSGLPNGIDARFAPHVRG